MMNALLIAALLGATSAAPTANCFASLQLAMQQALNQVSSIPGTVLGAPSAVAALLTDVNQDVSDIGSITDNCVLEEEDELTVADDYAALQPAFATAGAAMIANAATLSQYNQDGAITDELNTLVSTLDTTTSDVSSLVSSEGTIVEDAGDAITGTLDSIIQAMY